ncbi:hypothetical protein TNCV_3374371 [Trichonephila clavipes]|nr:hypothetical protein TNCV_3374371 [Trichonephila clavipes]
MCLNSINGFMGKRACCGKMMLNVLGVSQGVKAITDRRGNIAKIGDMKVDFPTHISDLTVNQHNYKEVLKMISSELRGKGQGGERWRVVASRQYSRLHGPIC